jgi:hypothetical protein
MKGLGTLILAQSLLLSAESLDYAGWKSRAEQLLGDHRSERSRNVTTPGGQKDKAAQAGEAWLAAARQCQDPALRFQALDKARRQLSRFSGSSRAQLEKRIQDRAGQQ